MDIHWYPGHMTKARRQMQEDLKLIDLIIEIIDARVPVSGRNPDIQNMGQQKSRIIILNKADMADASSNQAWSDYYRGQGIPVLLTDARNRADLKKVHALIEEACSQKRQRDAKRGIKNRPVRAMVAGIPNVGKSTFINSVSGRASTKTGNRPGVTKGKQWIHLSKGLDLLDTPGILWPKFEDQTVGLKLAMIGSVKDDVVQAEELAMETIAFLAASYPGCLRDRYGVDESLDRAEILHKIAENRNCIVRGTEYSTEKAASILMDEFRGGILGRFTLELPPAEEPVGGDEV